MFSKWQTTSLWPHKVAVFFRVSRVCSSAGLLIQNKTPLLLLLFFKPAKGHDQSSTLAQHSIELTLPNHHPFHRDLLRYAKLMEWLKNTDYGKYEGLTKVSSSESKILNSLGRGTQWYLAKSNSMFFCGLRQQFEIIHQGLDWKFLNIRAAATPPCPHAPLVLSFFLCFLSWGTKTIKTFCCISQNSFGIPVPYHASWFFPLPTQEACIYLYMFLVIHCVYLPTKKCLCYYQVCILLRQDSSCFQFHREMPILTHLYLVGFEFLFIFGSRCYYTACVVFLWYLTLDPDASNLEKKENFWIWTSYLNTSWREPKGQHITSFICFEISCPLGSITAIWETACVYQSNYRRQLGYLAQIMS